MKGERLVLNSHIYLIIFSLTMVNFYYILKSNGPLEDLQNLQVLINSVEHDNKLYALRNKDLAANINFIQNNDSALEEEARLELGLVKPCEQFYQVVEPIE